MFEGTTKTLFFTIASEPMFRNFACVEGGVLDQLSKDPSLRIVLLIKRSMSGLRYISSGKNVEIVPFDEYPERTLIQQAFSFFYAYLLFTDTTRLVSSYGVRSDKPRPLIRYWNYPLKLVIGKVLAKSDWLKNTLVTKLYLHIYKNRRPYRQLFEYYRPDLAFLTNICGWPTDLDFLVEAKRQGIPTIGMPGNWDHLSKYFIPFRTDRLLVWSDAVKKEAVMYQGYDPAVVEVVGAPHIDFSIAPENRSSREQFLDRIGLPLQSKVILYASQGPYSVDGPDYVDMLLAWITAGKLPETCRIIIRSHPKALSEKGRYERFRDDPRVRLDHQEGWSAIDAARHYNDVLGYADVVTTTFSSVATDASVYDRPVVITNFDGYKVRPMYQSVRRHRQFTHFQNVIATGGVHIANSPDEFCAAVSEYLAHPEHDKAGRERLRNEVFGRFDGRNSERVAAAIGTMASRIYKP